jgi:hypothetical protein
MIRRPETIEDYLQPLILQTFLGENIFRGIMFTIGCVKIKAMA